MFLSFIIPIYNAERYLSECLNSLLAQDLVADEYEIVCVNDGSKDGSLSVLRDFADRYPNIRIIDKENGGVWKLLPVTLSGLSMPMISSRRISSPN